MSILIYCPTIRLFDIGGYNNATLSYDPKTLKVHENRLIITLNEVYIYDIINDSWNTDCDGQRIIIYRGYFNDPGYLDNSLYVLDLTIFNWYIPKTTGNIQIFNQNRSTLIGRGCDKSVESDILLLDISNNEEYIWITIFDPPDSNVIIPPSSSSNSSLTSSSHHYLHHYLHQ
ncbi:hypothetical protein GLOIN_2v1879801 [Rhizophagus irregularis DAOM 181602=DAOM 197198]|uniref:Uncharacterized protein n=1 Tax=Rhizophagus irregularis (strain DAOM 181602 / DAOM 197198 / MUCL 43194) TaxID=747089 RepID=U9TMX5_RHIID|nr:hypothetical protein GLOIN_2v1879801 [Rhizophagus irregularis DAOM 181602=DAOM 197198]POG66537.1 hypothetical protein GLOIN_2v1879801 [Rhizophagus irregularis DAOM 181602=DAOM 197198]|eukprot:XP_025173403.1 hypothetical protein GLOIN_2v1879801 [Rhizophagus irregularis DAOM 181602=DAOM 197198]